LFGATATAALALTLYDFMLNRSEVKQMNSGLVYTALNSDQLHIGLTYSSDGHIEGFNFKPLENGKHFFLLIVRRRWYVKKFSMPIRSLRSS